MTVGFYYIKKFRVKTVFKIFINEGRLSGTLVESWLGTQEGPCSDPTNEGQ